MFGIQITACVFLNLLTIVGPAATGATSSQVGSASEKTGDTPISVGRPVVSQEVLDRLPQQEIADKLFQNRIYSYSGGRFKNRDFQYRLYVPPDMQSGEEYPLVLWLHGYGDGEIAGLKNWGQLLYTELVVGAFDSPNKPNLFLLAMQCPADKPEWFTAPGHPRTAYADGKGDEPLTVLMEILDKTIEDLPVDTSRISVVGISSGGTGAWELAMREPNRFAAVAPFGSSPTDFSRVDALASLPIWAFHSAHDLAKPPGPVRDLVAAVRRSGGTARITEVESYGHNCWDVPFRELGVLSWLLAQQQGRPEVNPPDARISRWKGQEPWKLDHRVLQAGIPIMILGILWWELRRRNKLVASGAGHLSATPPAKKPEASSNYKRE